MSFTEMMQQAIQIRTSTDAKLRVDFDSRPKFQQSSMFATQEVQDARRLPLKGRLAVCTAMKLRGNEQMRVSNYGEACEAYEQALAMFWYLENRNSSWKTSGIKDEDITEVNFHPACGVKALEDETGDLKVALLLNIARAYSARSDYATSVKACDAALASNPSCAKALYLRGKALVTPASAGAFETEGALRDVSRAAELAPGDSLIRGFLAKLRAEKARQKEADRATFAGMFGRGSVCDPEAETSKTRRLHAPTHGDGKAERGVRRSPGVETGSEAPNSNDNDNDNGNDASDGGDGASGGSKKRSGGADERRAREMRRDVEKKVELLKGMVREFDEEGRDEEADQYRERLAAIEEILSEHDRQEQERVAGLRKSRAEADWRNPSEAMLERAEEEEYDLGDPAVVSFLVKMQEGHRAKVEAPGKEGRPHGGGGGRGGGGGSSGGGSGGGSSRGGGGSGGGGSSSGDGGSGTGSCTSGDGPEDSWDSDTADRDGGLSGWDVDQDDWTAEIWKGAILCMTRPEVTALLKEDLGFDPRPDTSLRELRNLAVCKLLGEQPSAERTGNASSTKGDEGPERKRADWKISAAISFLLFLFKAYQMGLWKWLLTGGSPPAGPVGPPGFVSPMTDNENRVNRATGAARGRARGRRGWERRPYSSGVDADDARSARNTAGGGDVGGSSLAAQVLASATQAVAAAPSEESLGGWFDSSADGACIAGEESGKHAVKPTAEDDFEFLAAKWDGEEQDGGHDAGLG